MACPTVLVADRVFFDFGISESLLQLCVCSSVIAVVVVFVAI